MGRDPDYLAFYRQVAAQAQGPTPFVAESRKRFSAAMARLPRPEVERVEDVTAGPIGGRLFTPGDAGDTLLAYVHGGGWHLGDLDSWEPVARVIATATGCRTLLLDHRQAPEHPFPEPLEDVVAALTALTSAHDRVAAIGDSSGGNLVAAATREVTGLQAQVLVYPVLDLSRIPEPLDDPDGIVMPRPLQQFYDRYTAGADARDPRVSPLLDPGAPPKTLVVVAEYDLLAAEGRAYARRTGAQLLEAHGLDHAFLAWGSVARRPQEAIDEFGAAVRELLA